MKKISLMFLGLFLMLSSLTYGAALQWQQTDYDNVDGWTFYYNEEGQSDAEYTKTILKTDGDLSQVGDIFTYQNIESNFILTIGKSYSIYLRAYNSLDMSPPSNTVLWTRPGYEPPGDNYPTETVINIPSGPVTINIIP